MKQYIIWLKSGEHVEGTIEDERKLKTLNPFILRFDDTEGKVAIKKSRIEAIGINDIADNGSKMGF